MHIAPLRPFGRLVDDILRERPDFVVRAVSRLPRFATREGEHAYAAIAEGSWLGEPARRTIAMVVGDDTCHAMDLLAVGTTTDDARALDFAHGIVLRLGIRPRRYYYTPPHHWRGHATGLVTRWFPADFPARSATIVVYPANPTHEDADAIARSLIEPGDLETVRGPTRAEGRDGLVGWHLSLAGLAVGGDAASAGVVHRDVVVFASAPYTYALQADAYGEPDPDVQARLLALATTVEPVPQPGGRGPVRADASAFAHYV